MTFVIPSEARNRTGPDSGIGASVGMSAIPRLRLGMTSVAGVPEGKRVARNNVAVDRSVIRAIPMRDPANPDLTPR